MADFAPDGQPLTQDEYDYNFDALNHAGGSVYESETARRKRQRMDGRKEMRRQGRAWQVEHQPYVSPEPSDVSAGNDGSSSGGDIDDAGDDAGADADADADAGADADAETPAPPSAATPTPAAAPTLTLTSDAEGSQ